MLFPLPSRAALLAMALVAAACAPRAVRVPDPPPTGPFRTVAGAATHPRCVPPERRGADGAAPRCVVSFGRGTTAMTTSPDGTQALIALLDVAPTLWTLPAVAFGHHFDAIPAEAGHDTHSEMEGPQALIVAPDSRSTIFAVEDRLLRYDLASGKLLSELEGPAGKGMVDEVAWSNDGRRLLVTSAADGKARLLDVSNGRVLRTLPVEGRVVEMGFARDDRRVAVGTEVGTVAIVDLDATGVKPRVLTPSTQEITGLGFLGAELVVAARDGKLRVFDSSTGALLRAADAGVPITRCAIGGAHGAIAIADDQQVVRVFGASDLKPRAQYGWHRASIAALAWGVGPTLLAADNDGELAAWDVPAQR